MGGFLRMCAVSAVLSVTLVTAYNQAWSSQAAGGKTYRDRLPESTLQVSPAAATTGAVAVATAGRKGDSLRGRATCADETWPSISPACLRRADGAVKPVRMITVEERPSAGTSVLVRIPQASVASR